ncbi:MAG: PIN domain-containing protein [Actinomycetota bacterium]
MILLDASGLVGAFLGEPCAREVERLLRSRQTAITAANLTEVVDVMVRVLGNDLDAVEARLVPLLATTLPVVAIGEVEARRAAEIRISYYDRRDAPLSLADCLLLATASVLDAAVATSDVPLSRSARSEGLDVVALKDSAGRRP